MNCDLLQDLSNKTVLCIGCGRGDTTRELAVYMAGGGGRLIVTDISDEHFETMRADLAPLNLSVDFIRTSPLKLAGIRQSSIDLVVCNFTLSAINAVVGQGELALHKMYEVLKLGGKLYVEEELPYYMAASPTQAIWAEQWRLLKAAQLLAGMRPSNEYQPDVLEALVNQAGFEEVDVSDKLFTLSTSTWWPSFEAQVEDRLESIENETLKAGLLERKQFLLSKANEIGSIDVPYITLTAVKPWRID